MSRVAIYARVHETGLPVAWSAGRRRKHVGNHRPRCVIDPRCRGCQVIAYRPLSSWYPRESRAYIFFSFAEHRRRDNHRRNSGKFCSRMQVNAIYYRVYFGLSTPRSIEHISSFFFSPWSAFPSLFLFLILIISNEYRRLRAARQPVPRVTLRFIETSSFHSRTGCRKLQVNSLRAAGMKATIQRFNEAHRSEEREWVVTRTRNNARLREEKVFSVLRRDFASATPIARWWTRTRENFASIIFDREKSSWFNNFIIFLKSFSASLVARNIFTFNSEKRANDIGNING